jgi:hypothetical protein
MALGVLACACERKEPPGATMTPSAGLAIASSGAGTPLPPPPASAVVEPPSASVTASADPAPAPAASTAVDWKNEAQALHTAAVLEPRGRELLDAIVHDDVTKAHAFFFPQEPFTPLKDIKDPDRYWKHLYRAYEQDIHKLHRRHRDWSGVTFESIEPGTPPVWVPPGDEANKIGYFRSWGTKLRYRLGDDLYTVKIHTIISWQGQWHITHLLPWKKK